MSPPSPPKNQVQLNELAAQLRALADDLEQGKLRIGASLIDVEQPTFLKTKSELKGGSAYFALSVKMPAAGARAAAPRPRSATPHPTSPPPRRTQKSRSEGSGEGKRIKKKIAFLWKSLCRQIDAEEQISTPDSDSLSRMCEEYNLFVEPEWRDDWDVCCKTVQECLLAATAGNHQQATALVAEVNRLIKQCHKLYK